MICSNCRMQLPDDSVFCQYCGSKTSFSVQQLSSVVEILAPVQNTIPDSLPIAKVSESSNIHVNGNIEAINTKSTEKKVPKKWIATIISMSVLLLALAGFNIHQYISAQNNVVKVTELSEMIDKLNSTINEKDTHIKKQEFGNYILEKQSFFTEEQC